MNIKSTASISKNITLPKFIESHVPLKDKNWFGTGGPARYFAEPQTPDEFSQALQFAHTYDLNVFILGSGANLLISDDGFDGLVIRPQLSTITIDNIDHEHEIVTSGSGTSIDKLIESCLDHNLSGLEEFSGIPGTIGGAVYINIHYYEFFLGQFLDHAIIIHKKTGQISTVKTDWFQFGYDYSNLMKEEYFLASASFKLKKIDALETAFAKGRRKEIIRHRLARYPQQKTCGSFFRNFYPEEVSLENEGKKIIYAAYYLDKVGIKGSLSFGNAKVSTQHANMIVNVGNATSSDIINLAKKMQQLVKEHFGIIPQPECRLVGFKNYPLL